MPLKTPTLQTPRLLLRPFAEADAESIYALQSNARVLRYWDSPPWTDRARAQAFIAACRQMEEGGSGARVEAEPDTRNAASARVLEKLGFEREGLRREDCIVAGKVSDSWIYGLLRHDWKPEGDAVRAISAA
jgi:RimJ/RimL family protein N-acetyltransferase